MRPLLCFLARKTYSVAVKAGWEDNKRIAEPAQLVDVLSAAGLQGHELVKRITTEPEMSRLKAQIRKNTEDAVSLGICGVPTYQIGKHIVWGALAASPLHN